MGTVVAGPPGLNRAIADCTQPHGAYPTPETLRNIEVYLADTRNTDTVYEALVLRACAQPLSAALVEKVVVLLKTYLLRFRPSPAVQQLLDDFCVRARDVAGLSDSGRKATQYVRSCLKHLVGERVTGQRGTRASLTSLAGSLASSWGRSKEELSRLGPDGRVTVKVSIAESSTLAGAGRANDRYAATAADGVPSPLGPGPGQGLALGQAAARPTSGPGGLPLPWLHSGHVHAGRGWEDLRVPSGRQVASGAEPLWAVPLRPALLPPPPASSSAHRARLWLQHLPDLAPHITLLLAPPVTTPASVASSGNWAPGAFGSPSPLGLPPPLAVQQLPPQAPPISLGLIHRCVLDLEEPDVGRHMAEVLAAARAEAQQQSQPLPSRRQPARAHARGAAGQPSRDRDGAAGGRRARPARLLFHHEPYNRSEQLPMTEADVAVVVEAVCGVRAASALASVQGPGPGGSKGGAWEEEAQAGAEGTPEGMWQAAFDDDPDFGQMCGSILMKLLVDLWCRAGPVGSYTLALRMLRAALRSSQPATRARAFDVLYNLGVHGAMLRGQAEEAAIAAAAQGEGPASGLHMPWQVCASAPVSPFISGGGGVTPSPALRPQDPAAGFGTPPPAPGGVTPMTSVSGATRVPDSHSLGLPGSGLLDTGPSMSSSHLRAHVAAALAGEHSSGPKANGPATPLPGRQGASEAGPGGSPEVQGRAVAANGHGAAANGDAAPVGTNGVATGYYRWLRALLFQLLLDLCQRVESSETVWRAALGCTAQLLSHGGHWVAAWAQHLPPAALAGLLRAACNFGWSEELYAHLLRLAGHVLLAPPAQSPASAAAAGTSTAVPAAAASGSGSGPQFATAFLSAGQAAAAAAGLPALPDAMVLAERLEMFGGLEELLFHFGRAPTADSRAWLLTALVHCSCRGGSGADGGLVGAGVEASGPVLLSSSVERQRGNAAGQGGSPGGRGQDGMGPGAVLGVLQGLHLDSVCAALRGALQRPWPGMSSRLADVLATAAAELAPGQAAAAVALSPSASVSASASAMAEYLSAAAAANLQGVGVGLGMGMGGQQPAGVASPIAVRALLRPLLEALEASCSDGIVSPKSGELAQLMEATLAHVGGGPGGPGAGGGLGPPPSSERVVAGWRRFRAVCSEERTEARQVAIQWLHKLLTAACKACQGQLHLLSPLALKASPEANKLAAAASAALCASASASAPPLGQWNTTLADALLHVVREAPLGCELLMAAISRVAADYKAMAASAAAAAAAVVGGPDGAAAGGGGPAAALSPRMVGLAPGVAAAVAGGGSAAAAAAEEACRQVMLLYDVGLQWMLQCGSAAARTRAVLELADCILVAAVQPEGAAAQSGGGGPQGPGSAGNGSGVFDRSSAGHVAGRSGGGRLIPGWHSGPLPHGPVTPQQQHQLSGLAASRSHHQLQASTQSSSALPHPHVQEPGGGMLVSQQLLAGLASFDSDALACTPPKLLVSLLQQLSQGPPQEGSPAADTPAVGSTSQTGAAVGSGSSSGGVGGSMLRGFVGRPCPMGVAATALGPGAHGPGGAGGSGHALRSSGSTGFGPSLGGGAGAGDSHGTHGSVVWGSACGPWQDAWQDRRLAVLLLLMARCSLDPEAFADYSLSHIIKSQLECEDLRCRYYASVYLLQHWKLNQHDKYWRTLRQLIGTAQQCNDERLLDNPYLQMRAMLQADHAA